MSHQHFKDCIDACVACAIECSHCAAECIKEEDVAQFRRCIQLDLECAAICRATAEVMSLGSDFSAHLCRICADVCNACAVECERFSSRAIEHCIRCADACRSCAEICEEMATEV